MSTDLVPYPVQGVIVDALAEAEAADLHVQRAAKAHEDGYMELGRALLVVAQMRHYEVLGFGSIEEYVEKRLDRGARWWRVVKLEVLARLQFPELDQAIRARRIKGDLKRALLPILTTSSVKRLVSYCTSHTPTEAMDFLKTEKRARSLDRFDPAGVLPKRELAMVLSEAEWVAWQRAVYLYRAKYPKQGLGEILRIICVDAMGAAREPEILQP